MEAEVLLVCFAEFRILSDMLVEELSEFLDPLFQLLPLSGQS